MGSLPTTVTAAYTALDAALAEAEQLWGPTDGLHALPQAIQLRDRIEQGRAYCEQHPDNAKAKRHLARLRRQYAQALADAQDRERCRQYREAEERFEVANRRYLELVRKGES